MRGLAINRFTADAITFTSGSGGNLVEDNYIGVDVTGTLDRGTGDDGIDIDSANNVIRSNVISGNNDDGIVINLASASGNLIVGNLIGTDAAGMNAIGNGNNGIRIRDNAAGNTVGGTTPAERNVISGNSNDGVQIVSTAGANNIVLGNYIGTDVTGTAALANGGDGVEIQRSAATVGGTAAGAGNLISGNAGNGILITGEAADGNLVQGNYIGTDLNGTAAVGNTLSGVRIELGADNNTIGGTAVEARNVISGNGREAVLIMNAGTTGNVVAGNYLGVRADLSGVLGNAEEGVQILSGASGNTIGGTAAGAGNVIGGNLLRGIEIDGSSNNQVFGNFIGTDSTGTLDFGNLGLAGVVLRNGATGNLIGGVNAGEANTIAFNAGDGVFVRDAATANNPIRGNAIYSNGGLGIDLLGSDNAFGVTANDIGPPPDTDGGPHGLQNYPNLSTPATDGATTLWMSGRIDSTASTTFTIDVYANPAGTGDRAGTARDAATSAASRS